MFGNDRGGTAFGSKHRENSCIGQRGVFRDPNSIPRAPDYRICYRHRDTLTSSDTNTAVKTLNQLLTLLRWMDGAVSRSPDMQWWKRKRGVRGQGRHHLYGLPPLLSSVFFSASIT